jgi:hypothetical protein
MLNGCLGGEGVVNHSHMIGIFRWEMEYTINERKKAMIEIKKV